MERGGRLTDAPDDLLSEWAPRLPRGRALDLGAGEGKASAWLADQGFAVDAVERDPAAVAQLRRLARRRRIEVHAADVCVFEPARESFDLILALALLHFLPPADRRHLATRVMAALRPGGVLIARAFVEPTPAQNERRVGGAATGASPGGFHPLAAGELPDLFAALEIEVFEIYRLLEPDSPSGFRRGAAFVGRRPEARRV